MFSDEILCEINLQHNQLLFMIIKMIIDSDFIHYRHGDVKFVYSEHMYFHYICI